MGHGAYVCLSGSQLLSLVGFASFKRSEAWRERGHDGGELPLDKGIGALDDAFNAAREAMNTLQAVMPSFEIPASFQSACIVQAATTSL